MGMAASQARFLNLTARKTNIEFEGAQINQQRTALSNESANLYNQMLGLQVPTPPNTQDYTKIEYTFMMPGGNDQANISQIVKDASGTYTVVFSYKTVELGMAPCTDSQKPKVVNIGTDSAPNYQITTSAGKVFTLTQYTGSESGTEEQKEQYKLHNDAVVALKGSDTSETVFFVNVGTQEKPKYEYFKGSELKTATAAGAQSNAVTYYTASDVETYKEDKYSPCTVSRDTQNRVQSFTVTPATGTPTTFAVTTSTVTDEAAYNDAMNEYTYKSYLYEQEMNNINAKSSIIHAQDRELELKLKQLDTEHNAVQTEIETVKSVCKKNVEDSFKTFA